MRVVKKGLLIEAPVPALLVEQARAMQLTRNTGVGATFPGGALAGAQNRSVCVVVWQAYLEKERGLSPETYRAFRLGYNPTNLYDDPGKWGLDGKKIWLPRGIVIPSFWRGKPWYIKVRRARPGDPGGRLEAAC